MSRSRVTLYSFSFRHHGRFSSFHRLLHYLPDCGVVDATFPLRKILSPAWHERLEQRWLRWSEWRLRSVFARQERQCIHYIHPENSLFQADLWKGRHGLVLTCHQPGENLRQIAREPAFQSFIRALKRADRVLLLATDFIRHYAEVCPPERLAVIPHGIDIEFFQPSSGQPGRRLILTVGNWLRDYDLWARVAIRLAQKAPDIEFAVAALPATVRRVQTRVEETLGPRVRFVHGLTDEGLRELYQQASVVFLPIKAAGANNALLEAMGCGVPVVISDLPAAREYAGDTALFFRAGNVEEALAALERVLADPAQRLELGRAGRQRALDRLSWQVIAGRYRSLYTEILSASGDPQPR
jgi:glycosyltransferase involved in cell wall biosynthesis